MSDEVQPEIQKIIDMIPLLHAYFGDEIGLFVSDRERYFIASNGAVKLHLKPMHPRPISSVLTPR